MDDVTEQVLDMVIKNTTLKRRVQPIILGWVCFNILILCLLITILWKLSIKEYVQY